MLTLKSIFILPLIALLSIAQADNIKICSFNIAELGTHRIYKDHQAIADIIKDFDLIVVQEVMDNGGEDHIKGILSYLNEGIADSFSYVIIPRTGRGFPSYEGYAFIYRDPVQLDSSYNDMFGLKETDVTYGRIPGWAYF
jgi:hypothetical protein